jgi:hypothetical protein
MTAVTSRVCATGNTRRGRLTRLDDFRNDLIRWCVKRCQVKSRACNHRYLQLWGGAA